MTNLALLAEAADGRGQPAIMRAAAAVVSRKDGLRDADAMSRLCAASNRLLPDSTDAYPAWAVAGEEYCLPCPACEADLAIAEVLL